MAEQARPGTNALKPDVVTNYVARIERLDGELETLKANYMNECKSVREDKKQVLKDAKGDGINPKALKIAIEQRALKRHMEAREAELDEDTSDALDLIKMALGDLADTPLGEAALPADINAA